MGSDAEAQAAQENPAGDGGDGIKSAEAQSHAMSWPQILGRIFGVFVALYIFLLGLDLMRDAIKCLGGRSAGSMFSAVDNPVAGLMVGIVATVLVQSSSTTTSIVVGLVGADQITVEHAIPIVMGANIGTSVTNTIVSMGQSGDRAALERAFAGATVHDTFNVLTVLTLLPLEIIVSAITRRGGPLYRASYWITESCMGGSRSREMFESPIHAIMGPVADTIIHNDKYLIHSLALGEPHAMVATAANSRSCNHMDCSTYYCVPADMGRSWQHVSEAAYEQLARCEGHILEPANPCGGDSCRLGVSAFYQRYIAEGRIIEGGFVWGAGDVGGGVIALLLSLVLLGGGLILLVNMLQRLLLGRARRALVRATKINDYAAILVGVLITIVVQSSSVTTSVLTPLCGMAVLPLGKMLPLTLGANIGTTVTALIAALAVLRFNAVQIALCHLFFNVFGMLIWFPIPMMRRVPLGAAELLGMYASFYRGVPFLYIVVMFVLLPLLAVAISALFSVSTWGGCLLLVVVLTAFGGFEFWWLVAGGSLLVLSQDQRQARAREIEAAAAAAAAQVPRLPTSPRAVSPPRAGPQEDAQQGELKSEVV